MKKSALFLILISFLFACKNDKKQDASKETVNGKTAKWEVKTVKLDSTNLKVCQDINCPKLDIEYLQFEGDSDFSKKVNAENQADLIEIFNIIEDKSQPKTLEEALTKFAKDYNKFKSDDPDSAGEYEAKSSQEVKSQNDKTVVVRTTYYLYTGGAHGYGATIFQNFDAKTGQLLTHNDLISDKKSFTDFVEKKFRLQYNIPPDANINSTGFFFEDDQFKLPQNIAVTDKEVILLYNPYEAANYAEGQLRFVFSKDKVSKWLNY